MCEVLTCVLGSTPRTASQPACLPSRARSLSLAHPFTCIHARHADAAQPAPPTPQRYAKPPDLLSQVYHSFNDRLSD